MKRLAPYLVVALASVLLTTWWHPLSYIPALAQGGCQFFAQTGKTVCGGFLQYWQTHGGLPQQGYPLSNELVEVSDLNGKSYTVQYFERAVFECHPENAPPNDVLLSQLGTLQFHRKYPNGEPVQPTPPPAGVVAVPGVPVTLLRTGATMTLSADPQDPTRIGYGCEQGEMLWIWDIRNNSDAPVTVDLDRTSITQVDSIGKVYPPATNCRGNTYVYAFERPTTYAPGQTGRAALVMNAGDVPPNATYFDVHFAVSGQWMTFRFPFR